MKMVEIEFSKQTEPARRDRKGRTGWLGRGLVGLVLYLVGTDTGFAGAESRASVPLARGDTFYVDSEGGSDENDGTAPERAWQTLARVNGMAFPPGRRILLKAGASYKGPLTLRAPASRTLPSSWINMEPVGSLTSPRNREMARWCPFTTRNTGR
jgi:hypothetical protein